jgi:hypothetical protein
MTARTAFKKRSVFSAAPFSVRRGVTCAATVGLRGDRQSPATLSKIGYSEAMMNLSRCFLA